MNTTVKRTLSGTVFLGVMIAALLLNRYLFGGLMLFILICMMHEFYSITMGDKYRWPRVIAITTGASLFVLMFLICSFGFPLRILALGMLPASLLMVYALFLKDKSDFGLYSHLYTALVYIAAPLTLSNLVVFHHGQFSGLLLLCFFIIIWCSDVGAYVFGITLGQRYGRKLCPSISPKKSWIGFWGGMIAAVGAAAVLRAVGMFDFPYIHCMAMAAIMHVAGVFGDLFESQWKRFYEVKDSGNIIPGHGGMLDRFDSSLLAMPIGVLYLVLFNLI